MVSIKLLWNKFGDIYLSIMIVHSINNSIILGMHVCMYVHTNVTYLQVDDFGTINYLSALY